MQVYGGQYYAGFMSTRVVIIHLVKAKVCREGFNFLLDLVLHPTFEGDTCSFRFQTVHL